MSANTQALATAQAQALAAAAIVAAAAAPAGPTAAPASQPALIAQFPSAAIQITMEPFIYDESTFNVNYPIWLIQFENYLFLAGVNIAIPAHANLALRHLLHAGGSKITEMFAAQGNPLLQYAAFRQILDDRFVQPVNTLNVFTFRNQPQLPNQSLDDFITTLQRLAIAAAIPAINRDQEIIMTIANKASSQEVRTKALKPGITLIELKAWNAAQTAIAKCSKIISTGHESSSVNAVRTSVTPRQCFNCGQDFPHPLGSKCPATGKECHQCGKLNHFRSVCMQISSNRPPNQNHNRNNSNSTPRFNNRNNSNSTPRFNNQNDNGRQYPRPSTNYTNSNNPADNNSNRTARNSINNRSIRNVNENDLFDRFKAFINSNKNDTDSSPEDLTRQRSPNFNHYRKKSE